jgi:hypothetical protein
MDNEDCRKLIEAIEALKAGTVTDKVLKGERVHVTIDAVITLDQFSQIWKVEEP